MYISWGRYTFPLGAMGFTIARQTMFTPRREPWAINETWQLAGMLFNQSGRPSDMTAKILELEAAFSVDNQNLVVRDLDGRLTAHRFLASDTVDGLRITAPLSYPDGTGVEMLTKRTFAVAIGGMRPHRAGADTLVAWNETVQYSGGGPVYGHVETLNGPPVKQLLRQQSLCRASQTGNAIGLYARPFPPAPIFPGDLVKAPQITMASPEFNGVTFLNWGVSWEYQFESTRSLAAAPNFR